MKIGLGSINAKGAATTTSFVSVYQNGIFCTSRKELAWLRNITGPLLRIYRKDSAFFGIYKSLNRTVEYKNNHRRLYSFK